jgi:hypothetical protein
MCRRPCHARQTYVSPLRTAREHVDAVERSHVVAQPEVHTAILRLQGIRVEVNGQVLSQGGDVTADQVSDSTNYVTDYPAAVLTLAPSEPGLWLW